MKRKKVILCILFLSFILSLSCKNIEANASNLRFCFNCGKPVFSDYTFCPFCSHPLQKTQPGEVWNKQYTSFAHVDLTSLTPYYVGFIEVFKDGLTDTMGNHYDTGICGFGSEAEGSNCYGIWDIGGKFNRLSATGIVLGEDKGSSYKASCRIYGDGILLYERSNIDSKTKPFYIEIDITGVNDLKIELFGKVDMLDTMSAVLTDVMLLNTR